ARNTRAKQPSVNLRAEAQQQLREELELERLTLDAEHRALLEAQQQLEESHDRYVDLFDFAPIGFATLDRSGIIHNVNILGAELLGWDRDQLIGKPLIPLLAKADRRHFLRHLAQVRKGLGEVKAELQVIPKSDTPNKAPENRVFEFISILSKSRTPGLRI